MSRTWSHGSTLWLAVIAFTFTASVTAEAQTLEKYFAEASLKTDYRPPQRQEVRRAEELFTRLLSGRESFTTMRGECEEMDFSLDVVEDNQDHFWILREKADQRRGRGFFVIRPVGAQNGIGTQTPVNIQNRVSIKNPIATESLLFEAPHVGHDYHTDTIALNLFRESLASACALNTVPRTQADLAHLHETYFQAFTRAFARVHPRGLLVQLHGFTTKKRKTEAGRTAEMIVSHGSQPMPTWMTAIVIDMKRQFGPDVVKLYPSDVRELGATTNTQAAMLRGLGFDGFLHVEMSYPLRKRLCSDVELRGNLVACVDEFTPMSGEGMLASRVSPIAPRNSGVSATAPVSPIASVDSGVTVLSASTTTKPKKAPKSTLSDVDLTTLQTAKLETPKTGLRRAKAAASEATTGTKGAPALAE